MLTADRAEDILPRLRTAAALASDEAKKLAPDVATRLEAFYDVVASSFGNVTTSMRLPSASAMKVA